VGNLLSMSDSSLNELIAIAQANRTDDGGAMNEIVRRFDLLAQRIGRSVSARPEVQDDATQEARVGLMDAVRNHRLGTPGFPAYARKYMYGAALRYVTSSRSDLAVDPHDEFWTVTAIAPATPDTNLEVYELLAILTPEQRRVAAARYVANDTVTEIARSLSVSVPAVSQRLATIHRALRPVVTAAVAT
jgi:RNA polymerase sigma factor (sigma-70 family)